MVAATSRTASISHSTDTAVGPLLALRFLSKQLPLALLLAAACGGDSEPDADTVGSLVRGYCEFSVRCGELNVASADACTRVDSPICLEDPAVLSKHVGGGGACVKALKTLECEALSDNYAPPEACKLAFGNLDAIDGARSPGASCARNQDCGVDNHCSADDTGNTCGTCVSDGSSGEGSSCEEDDCELGLYCDDAYICRKGLRIGEACSDDFACFSGNCTKGKCFQVSLPEGSQCEEEADCAGNLACADNICTKLVAEHGACVPGQCYDGLYCHEGLCAEVAGCGMGGAGDACNSGANCKVGLSCAYGGDDEVGHCRAGTSDSAPIGASCEVDWECDDSLCVDGECADPAQCSGSSANTSSSRKAGALRAPARSSQASRRGLRAPDSLRALVRDTLAASARG